MARGQGWGGTAPLVVGAGGLLLLAFGAKWLPGGDEINDRARQEAESIEQGLRSRNPDVRDQALTEAADILAKAGKKLDAQTLADQDVKERDFDLAARVRDLVYEVRSDHRDPGAMIAGRIAFYGGLILVVAAGVLLYRRTPQSSQGPW